MKKQLVVAGAVALAFAMASASPAFALPTTVDGTAWLLNSSDHFGVAQIGDVDNAPPFGALGGDGFDLKLRDPAFPDNNPTDFDCGSSTETIHADGDVVVDCVAPAALLEGDLTWDANLTIFSGDYNGLVGRLVYTLNNVTGTDMTLYLRLLVQTEECNQGVGNVATSSGDLNADATDSWLLCNNNNFALESAVWGTDWATSVSNDNSNNPVLADTWRLDNDAFILPAGESATFVFFVFSEGATSHGANYGDTDANLIAYMESLFDTTTLSTSRLWEDVDTADNWTFTSASSDAPALPSTGVDVSGLVLAAVALLGMGAVIVVRRRSAKA